MATFEQVEEKIRAEYQHLWKQFFKGTRRKRADLVIILDVGAPHQAEIYPGYSPRRNVIQIPVAETSLSDYLQPLSDLPISSRVCPKWRTDLVHEMVHEYEHKELKRITSGGSAFYRRHRKNRLSFPPFDQHGHKRKFCTAVLKFAPFFKMKADAFLYAI